MKYFTKALKIFAITNVLTFSNASLPQNKITYTVGVENIDYAPYFSIDANGNYGAFARDFLDLFAKKNNIEFKYIPMPIAMLYEEFINGSIDFKYPDNPNWFLEEKKGKNIIYSDGAVEYVDGVILKSENKNMDIKLLKSIGTINGFDTKIYSDKGLKIIEYRSIQDLIENLNSNNVDCIYFNVAVALKFINKNPEYKGKFIFQKNFPYTMQKYSLSTIKNKEIIELLNKFLKTNSKEINELKKKNKIFF